MQPTEPNIKRKNRSPLRVIINTWGCLLGFVMLGLGGAIGLLGAIFIGPQILGFDATATALSEREIVLASTQVELEVQAQDAQARSTTFALDVQATQAILNNNADLIAQTETQSSQNIIATNTASAVQNVQRQTQVANDFAGTQAALNANATQVELDFRNTQSALGININTSQSNNNVVATTPSARYTFDFTAFDANTGIWQLSNTLDWQTTPTGIRAVNDAWLLETSPRILSTYDFDNIYSISATISPATILNADYWIIIGVNSETGIAVRYQAETLTVTQAGIYTFERNQLDNLLSADSLAVLRRVATNVVLTSETELTVSVNNSRITVQLGDEILLELSNVSVDEGAIGVQLPSGATLRSLAVKDQ